MSGIDSIVTCILANCVISNWQNETGSLDTHLDELMEKIDFFDLKTVVNDVTYFLIDFLLE